MHAPRAAAVPSAGATAPPVRPLIPPSRRPAGSTGSCIAQTGTVLLAGARRFGFVVSGLRLLVPESANTEYLEAPRVAAVHDAPRWMLGVFQARDEVFPLFDLAALLGALRAVPP